MVVRSPTRRDAVLILLGALCTHLLSILAPLAPQAIVISHSIKGPVILESSFEGGQVPGDVVVDEADPPPPDTLGWDLSGEIPTCRVDIY